MCTIYKVVYILYLWYTVYVRMVQTQHSSHNRFSAVCVKLVQTIHLPPLSTTVAAVQLQEKVLHGPLMFESSLSEDLEFADSLVHVGDDGCCQVLVTNLTGFTQKLREFSQVGLRDISCFSHQHG